MKPDWNDAPEWANYVAMDADGEWYWFAKEPLRDALDWQPSGGQCELANTVADVYWIYTKESRP
jgi:hypothetical protein